MTAKTIKALSLIGTVVGAAVSFLMNYVSDEKMKAEVQRQVTLALEEREKDNAEEEEELE